MLEQGQGVVGAIRDVPRSAVGAMDAIADIDSGGVEASQALVLPSGGVDASQALALPLQQTGKPLSVSDMTSEDVKQHIKNNEK